MALLLQLNSLLQIPNHVPRRAAKGDPLSYVRVQGLSRLCVNNRQVGVSGSAAAHGSMRPVSVAVPNTDVAARVLPLLHSE